MTRFAAQNENRPRLGNTGGLDFYNRRRVGTENGKHRCPHFQHLLGRNARGVSVTIHQIQQLVAARFGVTVLDLVSRRQGQATYRPRQVAFWLARHLTPCAMREIGRAFGGRDHTTVMHGIDRVDAAIAAGDPWGGEAVAIRNNLAGRTAVVPVSAGGASSMDNLATACVRCNLGKHARTPEEWRQ